ncbi:MAG: T9SS C-terminal target domain-containing protein, partial [Chitinophagaceae bacterium]
ENYSTVLHLFVNNAQNFAAEVIIHEENDKIYFYENNEFKLLFDYSISIGDTLEYFLPSNAHFFEVGCGGLPSQPDTIYYALIIDIDTLQIADNELLEFHTETVVPEEYDHHSYSLWDLGVFTKYLGSNRGLFGMSVNQCLAGYLGFLRCYEDNTISYLLHEPCDFSTTNISETKNCKEVRIYPNPLKDILNITISEGEKINFQLFNINGKTILDKNLHKTSQIFINQLKPGLYFYSITVNEERKTGKLIKE